MKHKISLFFCCCLPVIMWFLFGEVSSSSGYLGWATLFYCGTPCAFHIIIWHLRFSLFSFAKFAIIAIFLNDHVLSFLLVTGLCVITETFFIFGSVICIILKVPSIRILLSIGSW